MPKHVGTLINKQNFVQQIGVNFFMCFQDSIIFLRTGSVLS
jgi:hypothetical protein